MRALLKADLQALRNVAFTRKGISTFIWSVVVLGYLSFLSQLVVSKVLDRQEALELLTGEQGEALQRTLIGMLFLPVIAMAVMFGMRAVERMALGGGQVEMLLTSPLARRNILFQTWLHQCFNNTLLGCAFLLPWFLFLHRFRTGAPGGLLLMPIAVVSVIGPLIALLIFVQVFLMRWFASRKMKLVLSVFLTLFSLLVAVSFVASFTMSEDSIEPMVQDFLEKLATGSAAPYVLDVPGALVGWGEGFPYEFSRLLGLIGYGLFAIALILAATPMYLKAYANSQVASAPSKRKLFRRRGSDKSWPASVAGSLARMEWVLLWQQPGRIFGNLVYVMVMIFLSLGEDTLKFFDPYAVFDEEGLKWTALVKVPEATRQAAALFKMWAWPMLMFLPGAILNLTQPDRQVSSVLVGSPASRRSILLGKLWPLFAFPLFYALCTVIYAVVRYPVNPLAIAAFLALAPGVILPIVMIATVIGTFPPLVGFRDNKEAFTNRDAFMLFLVVMVPAMSWVPGVMSWNGIRDFYKSESGPFFALGEVGMYAFLAATIWIGGLILAWLSLVLATRNVEKLYAPMR